MPKLTQPLTDKVMRHLPTPETGSVLWYDPELKGFAGRVTANGARAFVGTYHFGGVERRDTIGGFPEWKATAARDVFKRWKRDVDLRIDPRGDAPSDPQDATFKALAERFLAHARTSRGRQLRPLTITGYRRALMVYAEPLHSRAVDQVRRRDAANLIRTVAEQRGSPTAMSTRAAGSRFYSWLIANDDRIESNPFVGTEGYSTPKGERVLHDGELIAIWAATDEPTDYHMIVRLLCWTGARRQEIGSMCWPELSDDVWTVPGSRTKNARALALPMPRQMREALEAWPRRLGRDLLFGSGPSGFTAWSKSKARLDAKLGFAEPWHLHDIRRSVQSRMAGLGIPKDYVNRVLNHAVGPIAETYDRHTYYAEKSQALQTWADELARIVSAGPNVVELPKRG
jgi:integrase